MASMGEIAERLRRVTVQVRTPRQGRAQGSGSGVLWPADGIVITNAHVATTPRVDIETWDGNVYPGQVIARDPRRDLASVRIPAQFEPAPIGDSAQLRPGEVVLAVGNPLGFVGALSSGVVHGVGGLRGLGRGPWVQASIRLAPGNSGGPLADAQGRVVGINTMVMSGGLALAVPSNAVQGFLAHGSGPSLGITIRPVVIEWQQRKQPALLVLEVDPNSAAAHASMIPGDLIIGTDRGLFDHFERLSDAIDEASDTLTLQFLRGERTRSRQVTVQLRPEVRRAAA